jgi:hypothetical protein
VGLVITFITIQVQFAAMAASFHSFNLASMGQQLLPSIPCLTAIDFGPHFIDHPPHPILKLDSFGVY